MDHRSPPRAVTVIQIYATGEGVTTPPGVTGSITGTDLTKPALPALVSIGGVNAMVEYVGSAPDAVTGLLQVNALVPLNAPTGPAVGISLTIGTAQSPAGVTVAVE